MDRFETNIELGLNLVSKILGININWNYAVIDENTPKDLITKVLMAYDSKTNCVLINPQLQKILEESYSKNFSLIRASLYSKLAHECRHAWQYNHPESFIINLKATYGVLGDEYIKTDFETDAYAFEEAFLKMMLEDIEAQLEFPIDAANIHTLAYQHYDTYVSLFAKYI